MKKTTSWLIIGLCSFFLLLFLAYLVVIIITIESFESIPQFIIAIAGNFLMIYLTVMGIRYGIKQLKPKEQALENYTEPLNIQFKGQINYKEYRNLVLKLTFGRPLYFFFILIIFTSLITSLTTGNNNTIPNKTLLLTSIFIGFIILSPLLILYKINRTYKTNIIFREELNYTITNDSIHIKGNSLDSKQKWTRFYKIKETNSFFMLYQSDNIATLIEKNMLTSNEVNELKIFFQSLNLNK